MTDIQARMTEARDLIQAKRYDEARAILRTVDHPKAAEWLAKIDEIAPASRSSISPTPSAPRQPAQPTIVRSKLPLLSLPLLIIGTLISGIGVGVLLFYSAKVVYLIFASIIIAAALAGLVLMLFVKVGKVRAGRVALVFGALAGLLTYGTYWYLDYSDVRELFRQDIYREEPKADPVLVEQAIDDFFREETGSDGIVGYALLAANEGMTITRASSSSDTGGFTLSRELTMGYWVLEILIALGVPAGIVLGQTNQPFCEETNRWLTFTKLGHVPKDSFDTFLDALQAGDFRQAGSYMQAKQTRGLPRLTIHGGRCHEQSPEGRIKITAQHRGRNNTQEIFNRVVPAGDYEALDQRR